MPDAQPAKYVKVEVMLPEPIFNFIKSQFGDVAEYAAKRAYAKFSRRENVPAFFLRSCLSDAYAKVFA